MHHFLWFQLFLLHATSTSWQCSYAQPAAAKQEHVLQDRVECGGEQMAEVAQRAEQITKETGELTRVVGWYHSHPHITVLPSHIDIATQVWAATLQLKRLLFDSSERHMQNCLRGMREGQQAHHLHLAQPCLLQACAHPEHLLPTGASLRAGELSGHGQRLCRHHSVSVQCAGVWWRTATGGRVSVSCCEHYRRGDRSGGVGFADAARDFGIVSWCGTAGLLWCWPGLHILADDLCHRVNQPSSVVRHFA